MYAEVVALSAQRYGADHPMTAAYQVHLADRMVDSQPVVAESLYRHAITIQRVKLRRDDISFTHSLASLSALLLVTGRHDEALALRTELTELHQRVFGTNHPAYARSLDGIAEVLIAQRRFRQADSLFHRSLDIQRAAYGESNAALASHHGRTC